MTPTGHYPTSEPAGADVQLIPEVKSLVEHTLAELAEPAEWETIVRAQLDAIHERSQRPA